MLPSCKQQLLRKPASQNFRKFLTELLSLSYLRAQRHTMRSHCCGATNLKTKSATLVIYVGTVFLAFKLRLHVQHLRAILASSQY